MPKPVSVTVERLVAASTSAIWTVICDPAMHERLDPRCRLESKSGGDGHLHSEYVLMVRASALARSRLRYLIVRAHPQRSLVAEVFRGGKKVAEQRAEIAPSGEKALLRWTVVLWTGALSRRLTVASCERQLRTWLSAVERESASRPSN